MNRRTFLASMAVTAGSLMFRRSAVGQALPATRASSSAGQSEAIRIAALQLLQTLTPDRRDRVNFAFPKGQSPTAVGFGAVPMRPGGSGGTDHPRHDVSF